jgi:hypothetical protein
VTYYNHRCNGDNCAFGTDNPQGLRNHYRACAAHDARETELDALIRAERHAQINAQLDAEDAAREAEADRASDNRCPYCRRVYANIRNRDNHMTRCARRKAAISEARAWEISHATATPEGTDMARDNSPEAQQARKIQGAVTKLSLDISNRLGLNDDED